MLGGTLVSLAGGTGVAAAIGSPAHEVPQRGLKGSLPTIGGSEALRHRLFREPDLSFHLQSDVDAQRWALH